MGEDTHSFANALKHVLRQDPDIILVGEMRDLATIQAAIDENSVLEMPLAMQLMPSLFGRAPNPGGVGAVWRPRHRGTVGFRAAMAPPGRLQPAPGSVLDRPVHPPLSRAGLGRADARRRR